MRPDRYVVELGIPVRVVLGRGCAVELEGELRDGSDFDAARVEGLLEDLDATCYRCVELVIVLLPETPWILRIVDFPVPVVINAVLALCLGICFIIIGWGRTAEVGRVIRRAVIVAINAVGALRRRRHGHGCRALRRS